MSFWKSLFGGAASPASQKPAAAISTLEHEGFLIEALPYPEGGQFQIAGTISKTIDGVRREHRFVRADRCVSIEDAATMSIRKGQQIIEHLGERMFE